MSIMANESSKCLEEESCLEGKVNEFVETVIEKLILTVVHNQQWLNDAKEFAARTFPSQETETRVLPLFHKERESLVSVLFEYGKKYKVPMLIVYSRDIKQLVKARFTGGLYETLEKINETDHEIIVIDRRRGLFFIKVYHINEKEERKTVDQTLHLLEEKCDSAKKDFGHLKAMMMEVGIEKNQVQKCFYFNFPIVAFPEIKNKVKLPQNTLVLNKEECCNQEVFETWWNENVIEKPKNYFRSQSSTKSSKNKISVHEEPAYGMPDHHLTLLAV